MPEQRTMTDADVVVLPYTVFIDRLGRVAATAAVALDAQTIFEIVVELLASGSSDSRPCALCVIDSLLGNPAANFRNGLYSDKK